MHFVSDFSTYYLGREHIQLPSYYTSHKLDFHLAASNLQGLMHLVPFGARAFPFPADVTSS